MILEGQDPASVIFRISNLYGMNLTNQNDSSHYLTANIQLIFSALPSITYISIFLLVTRILDLPKLRNPWIQEEEVERQLDLNHYLSWSSQKPSPSHNLYSESQNVGLSVISDFL